MTEPPDCHSAPLPLVSIHASLAGEYFLMHRETGHDSVNLPQSLVQRHPTGPVVFESRGVQSRSEVSRALGETDSADGCWTLPSGVCLLTFGVALSVCPSADTRRAPDVSQAPYWGQGRPQNPGPALGEQTPVRGQGSRERRGGRSLQGRARDRPACRLVSEGWF